MTNNTPTFADVGLPKDKPSCFLLITLAIYIFLAPTPWWPAVRNIAIFLSLVISLSIFIKERQINRYVLNLSLISPFIFSSAMSLWAVFYGSPFLPLKDLGDIRIEYIEPLIVLFAGSILLYKGQEKAIFATILFSSIGLTVATIYKALHLDAEIANFIPLRDMAFRFLIYFSYGLIGLRIITYWPVKVVLLINLVLQLTAFFLTGFRGGILALLVCIIFIMSFYGGWRVIFFLLAGVMVGVMTLKWVNMPAYEYVRYKMQQTDSSQRWAGTYTPTVIMMKDKWLLGFGYGDKKFKSTYTIYKNRYKEWPIAELTSPHNQFLQVGFSTGIVGLLSFCAILLSTLWFGRKNILLLRQYTMHQLPIALNIGAMGTLIGYFLVLGQLEPLSLNNIGLCLLFISFYSSRYFKQQLLSIKQCD